MLTSDSSSLLTGHVSFTYPYVSIYFLKVFEIHMTQNLLAPHLSLHFPTENLREECQLPLHSNSMFSVNPATVTCNKRCQCRDRALSRWQRRARSGIECSLGWMVVLQAPGKLLSQYHFQYVVFSEALMGKKKHRLKHRLYTNFQLLISHYYKLLWLNFFPQVILQAENWTIEDLYNKYQN